MNGYYALAIILLLIITGTRYFKNKKGVRVAGPLALLRTKHGVGILDSIANAAPRFWKCLYTFGIGICGVAMVYIFVSLLKNTFAFFTTPDTAAGAVPVIPGVTIPFWVGIIGLITVLVFHEMSHGIIARTEKIRVKTVGIATLGFLPIGAFVEPDENQLRKSKLLSQLRMYAAGSFMNFLVAIFAMLLLTYAFLPALASFVPGTHIVGVDAGGPAEKAGLQSDTILNKLNGKEMKTLDEFTAETKDFKPGQTITLDTNKGIIPVLLGDKGGRGWIGIQVVACAKKVVNPLCYQSRALVPEKLLWFVVGSFNWIVVLNLGIGMFNLLPLKPFDGGLIAEALARKVSPVFSKMVVRGFAVICIAMIAINLVGPYIF